MSIKRKIPPQRKSSVFHERKGNKEDLMNRQEEKESKENHSDEMGFFDDEFDSFLSHMPSKR